MNFLGLNIEPIAEHENFAVKIVAETTLDGGFPMEVGLRKPCGSIVFFMSDGQRFQIPESKLHQALWQIWAESSNSTPMPSQPTDDDFNELDF